MEKIYLETKPNCYSEMPCHSFIVDGLTLNSYASFLRRHKDAYDHASREIKRFHDPTDRDVFRYPHILLAETINRNEGMHIACAGHDAHGQRCIHICPDRDGIPEEITGMMGMVYANLLQIPVEERFRESICEEHLKRTQKGE